MKNQYLYVTFTYELLKIQSRCNTMPVSTYTFPSRLVCKCFMSYNDCRRETDIENSLSALFRVQDFQIIDLVEEINCIVA